MLRCRSLGVMISRWTPLWLVVLLAFRVNVTYVALLLLFRTRLLLLYRMTPNLLIESGLLGWAWPYSDVILLSCVCDYGLTSTSRLREARAVWRRGWIVRSCRGCGWCALVNLLDCCFFGAG